MSTSEPINRAVASVGAPTRPAATPVSATGARAVKLRKKKRRITVFDILAVIFMAFMLAFSLIPMAWMFSTSIKSQFAAIRQPPVWIPAEPTLVAYQTLLSPESPIGGRFLNYMWNSVKVSTATTIVGLLVAIPAACPCTRRET